MQPLQLTLSISGLTLSIATESPGRFMKTEIDSPTHEISNLVCLGCKLESLHFEETPGDNDLLIHRPRSDLVIQKVCLR